MADSIQEIKEAVHSFAGDLETALKNAENAIKAKDFDALANALHKAWSAAGSLYSNT
jgi:hypothetical protein